MCNDIHGNVVLVGDHVYIIAAARGGSQSMRLLYGQVQETTTSKATVYVYENKTSYSKTKATIVKPLE